MALKSVEAIKNAEVKCAEKILKCQQDSLRAVEAAKAERDNIINRAKADAEIKISSKTDKASIKADEIIVSASNSAKLTADSLSKECLSKQAEVNKEIINLII